MGEAEDLQSVLGRHAELMKLPKEVQRGAAAYVLASADGNEARQTALNAAEGLTGGTGRAVFEDYGVIGALHIVRNMATEGATEAEIAKSLHARAAVTAGAAKEYAAIAKDAAKQYDADVVPTGKKLEDRGIALHTLDEKLKTGDRLIVDGGVQAYLQARSRVKGETERRLEGVRTRADAALQALDASSRKKTEAPPPLPGYASGPGGLPVGVGVVPPARRR